MAPKPAGSGPVKSVWSAGGTATERDAATGTLTVSVPLRNAGTLAATLTFTITADRALRIVVVNEPGAAGLSGFQAWSKEG